MLSFAVFYAALVSIHTLRDQSTQASIRGSVYGSVLGLLTPAGICSMLIGGYMAEKLGVAPGSDIRRYFSSNLSTFHYISFVTF